MVVEELAGCGDPDHLDHWGTEEAYAFALLGFLTVHGLAGTVPSCTGADGARVLGSVTPGAAGLPATRTGVEPPRRLVVEPQDLP